MDFFTRSSKKGWFDQVVKRSIAVVVLLLAGWVHAQTATEISQLDVERADDDILVTAQVQFELPPTVEDALQKGVPLYFVAEAEILRERWYWYDKKVASAERHLRLAYQPLTRRWRLTVTSGPPKSGNLGLSLNQNIDSLAQALSAIKRISRWKIADAADLDRSLTYKVEFRFRLDLSQLPLPFQIGALGQNDWNVGVSLDAPLSFDMVK